MTDQPQRRNTSYCDADYRACAKAGMSLSQAARHLGVSTQAVHHAATRHKITFADGRKKADA